MSSLAAARADNYYYPREWRPESGSLNAFHGSHALGKRVKGDGVLVVRFEMPFNVWCGHCETHIGRGVRFNARKKKVGMYFTTILYEFRLKCAACGGEMVVETDPQQRGYKLVSGLTKQSTVADDDVTAQHGDGQDDDGQERGVERLNDPQVALRTREDPFFRLEHENADKARARERARGLEAVVEIQERQFKDDFASNAALRRGFREKKHHLQANARRADALGLGIALLDAAPEDVAQSKATVFHGNHHHSHKKRKLEDTKGDGRRQHSKARREEEDSFQFFGDAKASKLHQLKLKKKRELTKTNGLGRATPQRSAPMDRVQSRAKKLLARR